MKKIAVNDGRKIKDWFIAIIDSVICFGRWGFNVFPASFYFG